MPTAHGVFRCIAYETGDLSHLAFVAGDVAGRDGVLVRVHSECLTGDVLGSLRCDCGAQLDRALRLIGEAGAGVVVYLRGHEGRGIGIVDKLRAYRLQDDGFDTVDANLALGLPVDRRDFAAAAAILVDLGLGSIRLLTNNPAKVTALAAGGLSIVERVSLSMAPTPENLCYLRAKRSRLGHAIDGLDDVC